MRLFIKIIFWGLLTLILQDAYSQSRIEPKKSASEISYGH
jgi:hypothetical protein